jgi:DNA adenine methylase
MRPGHRSPWCPPVLRWAGSKRRLLPTLMDLVPANERYVEPFAGSAALFFALRPGNALLGDFNLELVTALRALKAHPRQLHRAVVALGGDSATYYDVRDCWDPSTPFEVATRFVYLNRHCFNGIYRTNRAGKFNVPCGRSQGAVPSEAAFYRCSYALRAAQIECWDFRDTLGTARAGDFVYVDPPYSSMRSTYGEYGYGSFSEADLADLVALLQQADRAGAKVVVSYTDDTELAAQLPEWLCSSVSIRKTVAGSPSHRVSRDELLLSNGLDLQRALTNSQRSKSRDS